MKVFEILNDFPKCSLEDINKSAPLLTRHDNKYVLDDNQIQGLLMATNESFRVLTLNATNNFQYKNTYLDTPEGNCFLDHKQGRRRRIKLRFRNYVDSGTYFFELKLKGKRGITEKFRHPISATDFEYPQLTSSLRAFCDSVLVEKYGRPLSGFYVPALNVNYERITLLSIYSMERVTIDHAMHFQTGDFQYPTGSNFWLVEIKSRSGRTAFDKYLVRNGSRRVKACSKYSVGFQVSRGGTGSSRFTSTIRKFCGSGKVTGRNVGEEFEGQKNYGTLAANTVVFS